MHILIFSIYGIFGNLFVKYETKNMVFDSFYAEYFTKKIKISIFFKNNFIYIYIHIYFFGKAYAKNKT